MSTRKDIELLAPARNLEIGIAAIDCGADAVYVAGPLFGARQAAGNSIDDIAALCTYAHRFGVRIYLTLNTLLFDGELEAASRMAHEAEDAGVDAFIVQDLAVLRFGLKVPLHASTQCAIRTPGRARFLESLGFSRLVLERQLSLGQIRAIRAAVGCELEAFVHGALCMSYSGNCFLSEAIAGRSANRGECIQACRSLYDLEDAGGRTLLRHKAVLSLKDNALSDRLADLAHAGICSFKIEGRLKGSQYVRNVVRDYSLALDELHCARSSFGKVVGGFTPDLGKTFNRGYTSLFFDGKRSRGWSSMDAPKHVGEPVGRVVGITRCGSDMSVRLSGSVPPLHNGDGFAFVGGDGEVVGFRGDVCAGAEIRCKPVAGLRVGTVVCRNLDAAFERGMDARPCHRLIGVSLVVEILDDETIRLRAKAEDGRSAELCLGPFRETARDRERMLGMVRGQLGKAAERYSFSVDALSACGAVPLLSAAQLNGMRRNLAETLDGMEVALRPLGRGKVDAIVKGPADVTYRDNVANHVAAEVLAERGAAVTQRAYELGHYRGAELMRSKYCVRYELGLCPNRQGRVRDSGESGRDSGVSGHGEAAQPLYLKNNGRRLRLSFDCAHCEMVVTE